MTRGGMVSLVAVLALALPAVSWADHPPTREQVARWSVEKATQPCPGAAISPDRVITGEIGPDLTGGYLMVPFRVPAGTTAVRVKYCHDQPEEPRLLQASHRLDFGLYHARRRPGALHGKREFRGWGGPSHHDVTISPERFFSEDLYRRNPEAHVPGRTTRGFDPGPIPPGEWAAELGVANVVPQGEGDATGEVGWRVEIELSDDPRFADRPYRPRRFDTRPAKRRAGWYAGDLHVHGDHSALGDVPWRDHFEFGFNGPPELDFVTASDHVNTTAWGELGRLQDRYPGKQIVRSTEIISYKGHLMNHGSARFVEYRAGPIYERRDDGSLRLRRGRRPARHIFDDIQDARGFTQVAHPVNFLTRETRAFCAGCGWEFTDRETDWSKVDAYEVHTGPANIGGPPDTPIGNPFTPNAIAAWDALRRRGFRNITAVAASDSHFASRRPDLLQSETGRGSTVVYAPELSERGITQGIQAGRAYVQIFGEMSPDLRFSGTASGRRAIMGDTLRGRRATLTARVLGGVRTSQQRTLVLLRDGRPIESVPVTRRHFARRFKVSQPGEYRIQVMRADIPEALTNPITLRRR